jgi:hypothetical protein
MNTVQIQHLHHYLLSGELSLGATHRSQRGSRLLSGRLVVCVAAPNDRYCPAWRWFEGRVCCELIIMSHTYVASRKQPTQCLSVW